LWKLSEKTSISLNNRLSRLGAAQKNLISHWISTKNIKEQPKKGLETPIRIACSKGKLDRANELIDIADKTSKLDAEFLLKTLLCTLERGEITGGRSFYELLWRLSEKTPISLSDRLTGVDEFEARLIFRWISETKKREFCIRNRP